jgi:hypothetical protein
LQAVTCRRVGRGKRFGPVNLQLVTSPAEFQSARSDNRAARLDLVRILLSSRRFPETR